MTSAPGPDEPRDPRRPDGPGVHGADPYGAGAYGADPYGRSAHGADPYGGGANGPAGRADAPPGSPHYAPAPGFGAYVAPGQQPPPHPVPGPPHPDNRPQRGAARRSAPVGVRVRGGTPYLTFAVMGVLGVVYLLQRATGLQADLLYWPAVTEHEPWRMLTAAVLHGGLAHLAFNMYALWIAGQALEPVVGRWRLAVLMLLSAFGGSTAVLLLSGGPGAEGWVTGVVGFSGAVMGLFAAVLAIQRSVGQESSQLLVLLVINIAIGFVPGWNISWEAHLGGMVVGLALGLTWSTWRRRPTAVAVLSSVAVAAALVAACLVYLGAVGA
ncbi:rhomboid family intramembrane serine protease [Georgenia sp. Z1344]|uniref:rhomboid family intramembrane serine protease n=1 Tax=Georgenia sp. Z1344 TaxID=3416706 RepID=UPI003CEC855D